MLYRRLATQLAGRPDALALQGDAGALNGRQLIALVDETAAGFQAEGLGAGSFIGWLGHNSAEMLAALLACAKLGAVFVPLNWRLAAPELAAIVGHAGLSALKHGPELAGLAAQVAALAPCAGPAEPAQPGDVMLVYTSGTTGEPKGAMHSQAGMCANIDLALAVQGLTAADRVLAVLPLFHVGGLCIQVLPALAVGAPVRLHARFDPAAWLHDIAAWRPSTSLVVPAVMQSILAHPRWPTADLSSLRFLNSGSSIVPVALIEAFHARGVPVAQVYGSTETGPVSIALAPDEAMGQVGSVGRPAPGVRLKLADAAGAEVPAGEVGEIQLRSPNLMRGYHRLPAGAGFVQGWFATGDLARADADGRITVVGRSKDMIISGGENIYPAEIENLAAAWPGVAEVAVVGLPDARWGEVPVLALTARPGESIDLAALRALFDARLARFKHPRRIVLVSAMPRTALGKVQKAVLRDQLDDLAAG
jgi:fatty-acyl-CoA synthase